VTLIPIGELASETACAVEGSHHADDPTHVAYAEKAIDLRNASSQFLAISLRQTARNYQTLAFARAFFTDKVKDMVDGFRLCLFDEPAGIDDQHISGGWRLDQTVSSQLQV
jgi:hypothetical protein